MKSYKKRKILKNMQHDHVQEKSNKTDMDKKAAKDNIPSLILAILSSYNASVSSMLQI